MTKQISVSFSRWAVIASMAVFAFYLLGNVIVKDVYEYVAVGAVFEILSLPVLVTLVLLAAYHLVLLTGRIKASTKLSLISSAFLLATLVLLIRM